MVIQEDINMGQSNMNEQENSQDAEMERFVEQIREEAKSEALENLSAEEELAIAQNFISKSGKRFMGSEGKYPFLSEAVNSDSEKLKRVSNLQQWEIEKIKVYNRLVNFLEKIGLEDFAKSVNKDKEDIMKLSTSKEGMLLGIAGTEAVISKSTQTLDESGGKKKK